MFDPRGIPVLPTRMTSLDIIGSVFSSLSQIRFGRTVRQREELWKLYRQSFDLELALARDFCALPSGLLEHHTVRLPEAFSLTTDRQIFFRLQRMIHAPGDPEAVAALLAAASYVTNDRRGKPLRRRLIRSLETLASELAQARTTDPSYVDAALHGRLDRCLDMIASDGLAQLRGTQASELLIAMARLWMLHDLQIIAARLHRSIYSPTDGFIESFDAGAQSFQSFAHDPVKMGEMAAIAARLLNRKPGAETRTDKADEQRLWGFVTSTEFKSLAEELANQMGFTTDELAVGKVGRFGSLPGIAKVLRRFSLGGARIGTAIRLDLTRKWDDRAPVSKESKAKSIAHLSASAVRYGMDAPTALAHAIVAFIELSDRLPGLIEQHLDGDHEALRTPLNVTAKMQVGHNRVTFERMFAAYRAIFLRDQSYLRDELHEMLPRTSKTKAGDRSPIFRNNTEAEKWRRDFVLGRISSVSERLGEENPLTAPDGIEPGKSSNYGSASLKKALAIIARNTADKAAAFDPRFSPALLWRLSDPLPPDLTN